MTINWRATGRCKKVSSIVPEQRFRNEPRLEHKRKYKSLTGYEASKCKRQKEGYCMQSHCCEVHAYCLKSLDPEYQTGVDAIIKFRLCIGFNEVSCISLVLQQGTQNAHKKLTCDSRQLPGFTFTSGGFSEFRSFQKASMKSSAPIQLQRSAPPSSISEPAGHAPSLCSGCAHYVLAAHDNRVSGCKIAAESYPRSIQFNIITLHPPASTATGIRGLLPAGGPKPIHPGLEYGAPGQVAGEQKPFR